MFGEDLPDRFWDLQEDDLRKCVAGRCSSGVSPVDSPADHQKASSMNPLSP
jgi:hypothetical protein